MPTVCGPQHCRRGSEAQETCKLAESASGLRAEDDGSRGRGCVQQGSGFPPIGGVRRSREGIAAVANSPEPSADAPWCAGDFRRQRMAIASGATPRRRAVIGPRSRALAAASERRTGSLWSVWSVTRRKKRRRSRGGDPGEQSRDQQGSDGGQEGPPADWWWRAGGRSNAARTGSRLRSKTGCKRRAICLQPHAQSAFLAQAQGKVRTVIGELIAAPIKSASPLVPGEVRVPTVRLARRDQPSPEKRRSQARHTAGQTRASGPPSPRR